MYLLKRGKKLLYAYVYMRRYILNVWIGLCVLASHTL